MKISAPNESFERLYRTVGIDAAVGLSRHFGGTRIYIPKIRGLLLLSRNEQIRRDFEMHEVTTADLSKKWGLTQRRVQQILRNSR